MDALIWKATIEMKLNDDSKMIYVVISVKKYRQLEYKNIPILNRYVNIP